MQNRRWHLFTTKLATEVQLKVLYLWKKQQSPTVLLHDTNNHKYWIASRYYACYRSSTKNLLTFFQKFWHSQMVSNPSIHIWLSCLASFCSALTQTSFHAHDWQCKVQRSLAVEVLNSWTRYIDHACISYIQLIDRRAPSWEFENDVVEECNVESHIIYTLLVFYGFTHFCWSHNMKIKYYALICPEESLFAC